MYKITTINNSWTTERIVSAEQLREENKQVNELVELRKENEQLKKTMQLLEEEIATYKQLVDILINEADGGQNEI